MRFASLLVASVLFVAPAVLAGPTFLKGKPTKISNNVYDELQRYAKFAITAYRSAYECGKPLNTTVISRFDNGSTQAYLSRDDTKKEYILSFRGTQPDKLEDILVDLNIPQITINLPEVDNAHGFKGHKGFHQAWLLVEKKVMNTLASEFKSKPTYPIVVTGHSLGGALASLAALEIKTRYPKLKLRLFTYGQPRVGDLSYALQMEKLLGQANIYRYPVAVIPPLLLGYRHFGPEYWLSQEPANYKNVVQCMNGEDKDESTDKNCDDPTGPSPLHVSKHSVLFGIPTKNGAQWCSPEPYHEYKTSPDQTPAEVPPNGKTLKLPKSSKSSKKSKP